MIMEKIRRLATMLAGIAVLCSSSLPWINGTAPNGIGIGSLVSTFVKYISGGNAVINFGIIDQIAVAVLLFFIGVVIIASSVLNSRKLAVVGGLLVLAIIAMWLLPSGITLTTIINNFGALGLGTDLATIGMIVTFVSVILAH